MEAKLVKDLMVPLHEYPTVSITASLSDAIISMENAQKSLKDKVYRHRAVLVLDKNGRVAGKIGELAFLKALEPGYNSLGDLQLLAKSGLGNELISIMQENYNFWSDSLESCCIRAQTIPVTEVMHPFSESVDENAALTEAIHSIVIGQTMSLLVRKGKKITGIIRLSDLFSEVAKTIKNLSIENKNP